MNRSVYHNHNGRGPIPNNSEDHYTESGPPEDHLYTELNTISRVIGQFAPTSDNQYTELHTTSRQLETDQPCPTTDHQYTALNTIQMTQTTNIPRWIQYKWTNRGENPNTQQLPFILFDVYIFHFIKRSSILSNVR